jgi:hypothetical protein
MARVALFQNVAALGECSCGRKLGALLTQAQLLLFDLDYQKGDQCKLLLGYLFKVA